MPAGVDVSQVSLVGTRNGGVVLPEAASPASRGGGSNVGAIVGGIIAGIVITLLLLLGASSGRA